MNGKPLNCARHGQHAGVQVIDGIYFLDAGFSDTVSQRVAADLDIQLFPGGFIEQLGIQQADNRLLWIKNDHRSHHRTRQWAAAYFVYSGNQKGLYLHPAKDTGSEAISQALIDKNKLVHWKTQCLGLVHKFLFLRLAHVR